MSVRLPCHIIYIPLLLSNCCFVSTMQETPLNVAVKLRCEAVEAYLNRAADPNILGVSMMKVLMAKICRSSK